VGRAPGSGPNRNAGVDPGVRLVRYVSDLEPGTVVTISYEHEPADGQLAIETLEIGPSGAGTAIEYGLIVT
jgi:hypothetical protein